MVNYLKKEKKKNTGPIFIFSLFLFHFQMTSSFVHFIFNFCSCSIHFVAIFYMSLTKPFCFSFLFLCFKLINLLQKLQANPYFKYRRKKKENKIVNISRTFAQRRGEEEKKKKQYGRLEVRILKILWWISSFFSIWLNLFISPSLQYALQNASNKLFYNICKLLWEMCMFFF